MGKERQLAPLTCLLCGQIYTMDCATPQGACTPCSKVEFQLSLCQNAYHSPRSLMLLVVPSRLRLGTWTRILHLRKCVWTDEEPKLCKRLMGATVLLFSYGQMKAHEGWGRKAL